MVTEFASQFFEDKTKEEQNNASDNDNIWSYIISLISGDISEEKVSQDNPSPF